MKIKRPLLTATMFFSFLIIAALTIVLSRINRRLNNLAVLLEQTAEQHLTANVALNTDLPLSSSFQIADDVTVGINMVVETVIPLNVEIPVNENILVPFKIGVKDYEKITNIKVEAFNGVFGFISSSGQNFELLKSSLKKSETKLYNLNHKIIHLIFETLKDLFFYN